MKIVDFTETNKQKNNNRQVEGGLTFEGPKGQVPSDNNGDDGSIVNCVPTESFS